jgi:hypothetical protein
VAQEGAAEGSAAAPEDLGDRAAVAVVLAEGEVQAVGERVVARTAGFRGLAARVRPRAGRVARAVLRAYQLGRARKLRMWVVKRPRPYLLLMCCEDSAEVGGLPAEAALVGQVRQADRAGELQAAGAYPAELALEGRIAGRLGAEKEAARMVAARVA